MKERGFDRNPNPLKFALGHYKTQKMYKELVPRESYALDSPKSRIYTKNMLNQNLIHWFLVLIIVIHVSCVKEKTQ